MESGSGSGSKPSVRSSITTRTRSPGVTGASVWAGAPFTNSAFCHLSRLTSPADNPNSRRRSDSSFVCRAAVCSRIMRTASFGAIIPCGGRSRKPRYPSGCRPEWSQSCLKSMAAMGNTIIPPTPSSR